MHTGGGTGLSAPTPRMCLYMVRCFPATVSPTSVGPLALPQVATTQGMNSTEPLSGGGGRVDFDTGFGTPQMRGRLAVIERR